MPLAGGYLPTAGATFDQLNAVTRRAFVPSLVVQTYQATPVLSAFLANAQSASGGVSSVTVPVQGSAMVTAQATDYSGSFAQPASLNGIQNGEYNLKAVVVPIPFLGMEGLAQMNAAVIPLIEARMNDAGNVLAEYLSTQMWTNATDGTVNIDGFPLQAAAGTYGNINGAVNTWWQGNTRATAGTVAPTRELLLAFIVSAAKANGGEMPNMICCAPGTWVSLAQDFIGQEQYRITPGEAFSDSTQGARSGFTALEVAGVPVFMDPNATEGEFYAFNTKYQSFYIHEAAAFAFTGFQSTLANFSLGYIGAVVVVLENILVKRKAITFQLGYTFATV